MNEDSNSEVNCFARKDNVKNFKKQEQKNTLSIDDEPFLKTFEIFWDKYPKKTAYKEAQKAWLIERPEIDEVLNALEWQFSSDEWRQENGRFIPKPARYVEEQRWKDALTVYDWTLKSR